MKYDGDIKDYKTGNLYHHVAGLLRQLKRADNEWYCIVRIKRAAKSFY
jgi:hypothetical protein